MRTIWVKSGLAATLCLVGASASAQDPGEGETTLGGAGRELGTSARGLLSDPREYFSYRNLTVSAGGGYSNFTDGSTQELTTGGGNWGVRAVFGMDQAIGIEGAYKGAAYGVETPIGDNGGVISTGLDALIRVGFPFRGERTFFLPYVTGGVGWNWYAVSNIDSQATGIQDDDNVFELPFGGGLTFGYDRFTVDARFLYRPSIGSEMFDNVLPGEDPGNNNWSITALMGYRF